MNSEDDCSMQFCFLDMKYDSFFMVFQKKNSLNFLVFFSKLEIVDALMVKSGYYQLLQKWPKPQFEFSICSNF